MQQIWARLQLLFAHGVATLVGADKVQARVLDSEVLNNLVRAQPYGFKHWPKAGAQVYLAFPSGDRSYGVALVIGDKRYQMQLVEGEVAIHDDGGNHVHLKRDGHIVIKAAADVLIDAPAVKITGSLEVGNGVTITGGLAVNGKNVSDSHTHTSTTPGTHTSAVN